mgnify:CR=1 FL=1
MKRIQVIKNYDDKKWENNIGTEKLVNDVTGFVMKPLNHPGINYDEFIQRENSGYIQTVFDNHVSKYVFKFRFLILIVGSVMYFKNSYNMAKIKAES